MDYREYLPSKSLQNIVQNYWVFEIPKPGQAKAPIQHETIPDSSVSIVLIRQPYFQGVRILGPHTQKFQQSIYPDSRYVGIKLLPWVTFSPTLFPKSTLLNRTTDAPDLVVEYLLAALTDSEAGESFPPTLLESRLIKLFQQLEVEQDDLIKFICLELEKGATIASLVDKVPFSIRVIQKKFKQVLGLTMRQYASNLRQRKLWEDLLKNEHSKLEVILKHRYYDQAHFINDFRKKMQRSHRSYEAYLRSIKISLP